MVAAADYRRHRPDRLKGGFASLFAGLRSVPAFGTGSVKHRSPPQRPTPALPRVNSITPVGHRPAIPVPRSLKRRALSAHAPRGQQARKISHYGAFDVATFGDSAEARTNHLATPAQIAATGPPRLARIGEKDTRRSKHQAIGHARFGARPTHPPPSQPRADDEHNAPDPHA
jgi:hypothetical protein